MKTARTSALAFALALHLGVCAASPTVASPPPPPVQRASYPPNSMEIANQYFDATVGGVRELVETYRDDNPDLYRRLVSKVEDIEAMKTRAWVVGWSTAVVGAALVVGGLAGC